MDLNEQIEKAKHSDGLALIVFYADWSPHYEWIDLVLHEFMPSVSIFRVNIEGDKKIAAAYEIDMAPSFVLLRKGRIVWEKTGEVFPGELKDIIDMFME